MKIRGQEVYPPQERIFRSSIPEPNSGCWLWLASARENGRGMAYGRMIAGPRQSRRSVQAHRYTYEAFVGPIPDGLNVCHKCDNPLCVNPDHLFLATQSENMADCYSKGRLVNASGRVIPKITEDDVREIRRLYAAGKAGFLKLGKRYGIDRKTVKALVLGRTWRHVESPPPPEDSK